MGSGAVSVSKKSENIKLGKNPDSLEKVNHTLG
jgi:hypothetical protein